MRQLEVCHLDHTMWMGIRFGSRMVREFAFVGVHQTFGVAPDCESPLYIGRFDCCIVVRDDSGVVMDIHRFGSDRFVCHSRLGRLVRVIFFDHFLLLPHHRLLLLLVVVVNELFLLLSLFLLVVDHPLVVAAVVAAAGGGGGGGGGGAGSAAVGGEASSTAAA